jgi:hypothetical protein
MTRDATWRSTRKPRENRRSLAAAACDRRRRVRHEIRITPRTGQTRRDRYPSIHIAITRQETDMPQQADTSKMRSNEHPNGSSGSGASHGSSFGSGSSSPSSTEPNKNEAVDKLKAGIVRGAHEISSEVVHVATDVAGQAKNLAESKLHEGKNFAGDQLGAVASALRSTSDVLRSKDSAITDYVEKAASSIDDVSIYLGTRTLAQLIDDVEGFARREPAVFLGGAFFAGLLGGRFLKAATPSRRSTAQRGAQTSGAAANSGSERTQPKARPDATSASSVAKDPPGDKQTQPTTATNEKATNEKATNEKATT